MEEQFELPVEYKDEQLMLKASLLVTGYTHKFMVEVSGQEVIFEPDEEGNYRAVVPHDERVIRKNIDVELLKTIAAVLRAIVSDSNKL